MIRNETGETLVELLVTIFIIVITVASVASLFLSIHTIQHRAIYTDEATRAAQRQIETLRNSPSALPASGTASPVCTPPTSLPAGSSCTATVTFISTGLWRADVSLTYPISGSPHTITLSSLIGVLGTTPS